MNVRAVSSFDTWLLGTDPCEPAKAPSENTVAIMHAERVVILLLEELPLGRGVSGQS